MTEKEKKDRIIGGVVSFLTHALLLILFIFTMAPSKSGPSIDELGIELEAGFAQDGAGEKYTPPASSYSEPELVKEVSEPEKIVEPEPEPVKEEVVENVVDESTTEKKNEPIKEKTEEVPKKEPVKQPKTETKNENVKETSEKKDKVGEPSGQGKGEDKTKDFGKEEGKLDNRALYGSQGKGSGPNLDMAGWYWDEAPKVNDNSNENGKLVFEITIDDDGFITAVRTVETTVSIPIERLYKSAVEKLTFSPTSDNVMPAPNSTGRITFIIRSK